MTSAKRTLPLSKRGFNFEIIMWLFTRFSVLAMYTLMLAGIIGALVVSAQTHANLADVLHWAFFPNSTPNPLSAIPGVALVAKSMVMLFILTVAAHGVHGILEISDDYLTTPFWQRTARNFIIVFFAVTNLIAFYVIFIK